MVINCLTTFPEFMESIKNFSIVKNAISKKKLSVNVINIRDFSNHNNRNTDDYPFGGGEGLLMTIQPIHDALNSIKEKGDVIFLSPRGKKIDQNILNELSNKKSITLLCGHYEGVDYRVIDNYVDYELSLGDFVLTGGEIPAMVLIDGISRLLPDVLGNKNSYQNESFYNGLLEYPQYTRPRDFNGLTVPDILLSGDHKKIEEYNLKQSILNTYKYRPDLIEKILKEDFVDKRVKELILNLGKEDSKWI